jgi:hypothetical protein
MLLTLRTLSNVLRDRSQWPAGFEWDYNRMDRCAMGLANELWNIDPSCKLNSGSMAILFGMPEDTASHIFCGLADYGVFDDPAEAERAVTPEQVASAIDAYLEVV